MIQCNDEVGVRCWEFAHGLSKENGVLNFDIFLNTCNRVMDEFYKLFGAVILCKIPLFVDNAVQGGGLTPITVPVLRRYIIIKLNLIDGADIAKTVYQFSHELLHFVFYCLFGFDKQFADAYEETVCSAMSFAMLKKFVPDCVSTYEDYALKNFSCSSGTGIGYAKGVRLSHFIDYNAGEIVKIVHSMDDFRKQYTIITDDKNS